MLEPNVEQGQLDNRLGNGLGGADKELRPDGIIGTAQVSEPEVPAEAEQRAQNVSDSTTVEMDERGAQQGPVANGEEQDTCTGIEVVVADPILLLDTGGGDTSDVGGGGGQGDDVADDDGVEDLSRATPSQGIVGGVGRARDEDDVAILFEEGLIGGTCVFIREYSFCAWEHIIVEIGGCRVTVHQFRREANSRSATLRADWLVGGGAVKQNDA